MIGILLVIAGLLLNSWLVELLLNRTISDIPVLQRMLLITRLVLICAGLIIIFRRQLPVFKKWKEIALLVVVTLLMLGCIEILLVLLQPSDITADNMEYAYITKLNSDGYRDDEFGDHADILLVGDSFVYSMTNDTYRLDRLIERNRTAYTVYNIAKPGIGPYEYVKMLDDVDADAEIVIVGLYVDNDIEQYDASIDTYRRLYDALLPFTLPRTRALFSSIIPDGHEKQMRAQFAERGLNASYLDAFISLRANPHLLTKSRLGNYSKYYDEKARIFTEYDATRVHLLELKEIAEERGADFAIVIFPGKYQVNRRNWGAAQEIGFALDESMLQQRDIQDEILAFCRNESIKCLDLLPAFKASDAQLYYRIDDHLTPEGNTLAAQQILQFLS